MTLIEIIEKGGGLLLVLMTLVQIAPIKINPWSWLAKTLGKALNDAVLKELEEVKSAQKRTEEKLETHIAIDDERNADKHRKNILDFNNELIRNLAHDREAFIDILCEIDAYEAYCDEHPNYKNNRAAHAIANIGRVYDERLKKRDFQKGEKET